MSLSVIDRYKALLSDLWRRRRDNESITDLSGERTRLWGLLSDSERLEVEQWIEEKMTNEQTHVRA